MQRIAPRLLPALALALALATPAALSAQFTDFEAALANFDAEVAAAVAEDAGGAVSVAVFQGDRVVWSRGWGWADIEGRVPADAHTIGRTGSISKTFTAVLMMQLAERGIIGLDDPVLPHLPEMAALRDPPVDVATLTFRQLASHTSGLQREPDLPGAARGPIQLWEDQILASIPTTGFLTPPGTEYAYSNIGYGMLGLALSRAAGLDFMELVQTLVVGPLGMEDSFFILQSPDHIRRMSVGYARDRDTGELSAAQATAEHMGRGYKVPNGGVYSTVHDLAAFGAALMGMSDVQILAPESQEAMRTPQAPAERYGLGLQIREVAGEVLAGHGGSVAGYNANLRFHARSGLGVAMLRTTSYNPPLDDLLLALMDAEATSAVADPGTTGSIQSLDPRFDAIVPEGAEVEVLAEGHLWTEGPVWIPEHEVVLYSDIPNNAIHAWSADRGASLWLKPAGYSGDDPRWAGAGSNGLLLDGEGRLLLAQHGDRRIARLTGGLSAGGPTSAPVAFETLVDAWEGRRFNSPNDLVLHSSGDLYFTDPPYGLPDGVEDAERELDFQGVYRLAPDGSVSLLVQDLSRPNGIALSPDERTLYVANSAEDPPVIMAYPVLDDGSIGEGRVFFDSWGDGMAVDTDGNLYVAGPDDGVLVLSPAGERLGSILVGKGVSNCAFGEDGSTLFITASDTLLRIRLNTLGAGFSR